MIDWAVVAKVGLATLMSGLVGYASAVLADADPVKAIASGIIAAGGYYLGNRQEKKDFT